MSVKPDSSSDDPRYQSAMNKNDDNNDETNGSAPDGGGQDIESLKAQAEENWDKYLRAAAELDNVRKRAARDMEMARKFALERFATELLAVKDSLEMGLQAAEGASADELAEGARATLKQFSATLERFGVTELDPHGEPFDPELHEAMTMQPSGEVEPNTVLTVFQKGYTLNGRLLRPARVVVSAAPEDSPGNAA